MEVANGTNSQQMNKMVVLPGVCQLQKKQFSTNLD